MSVLFLLLASSSNASANTSENHLSLLPVQDGGRIKPYDTFARESLQLIYGKAKFNGQKASEIVMTWMLAPEIWDEKEIVLLRRTDVKEALKLDVDKTHYTAKSLLANERLPILIQ